MTEEKMQFYRDLCPDKEYRVITITGELPGISVKLTQKCTIAVVAASGDGNGRVYRSINLHRPDPTDREGPAVDEMPFGFADDTGTPLMSGTLIQHGTWEGRTKYPVTSSWSGIVEGKMQAYVDNGIVPSASSGSISDLQGTSQEGAFKTLVSELSAKFDGKAHLILDAAECSTEATPRGDLDNELP